MQGDALFRDAVCFTWQGVIVSQHRPEKGTCHSSLTKSQRNHAAIFWTSYGHCAVSRGAVRPCSKFLLAITMGGSKNSAQAAYGKFPKCQQRTTSNHLHNSAIPAHIFGIPRYVWACRGDGAFFAALMVGVGYQANLRLWCVMLHFDYSYTRCLPRAWRISSPSSSPS